MQNIPGIMALTFPVNLAFSCRMPVAWLDIARFVNDIAKQKYIGFKLGETDTGDVWSAPSISVDDLVEAAGKRSCCL